MSDLIKALRPHQWVKNLLVFAALVFSLNLLDGEKVLVVAGVFALFCTASSAAYLVNDLFDRERDRLHPVKRHRAIASGRVGLAIALATISLAASALLSTGLLWVFASYFVLQLGYNLVLKRIPIVDAIAVSMGFLLRAVAGGVAIAEPISHWLLICTTFGAMFVSLVKRRMELAAAREAGARHRTALRGFSPALLDQLVSVTTAASLISYALYTTDPETVERLQSRYLPLTLRQLIRRVSCSWIHR